MKGGYASESDYMRAHGFEMSGVSWVDGDVREALDAIADQTGEGRRGALERIIREAAARCGIETA